MANDDVGKMQSAEVFENVNIIRMQIAHDHTVHVL